MSGLSVRAAAAEAGSRKALEAPGVVLTYRDLARRVLEVAEELSSRLSGARGVLLTPRLDTPSILRLLALFEMGVPAYLLHPGLTPPEKSEHVEAAEGFVLVDETASPAPGTASTGTGGVDVSPGAPLAAAPAHAAPRPPAEAPSCSLPPLPLPDDERTLVIVPTSGSTGRPKGVVLSRAAFRASAEASAANLGWEESDAWLLALPLAHVGGLSVLTRCLIARRCVVLPESRSPKTLAAILAAGRVSLASFVPAQLSKILEARPDLEHRPVLRAILLGGAAIPPPLLRECARRRLPVLATYGLTECCSQVATQRPGTPPSPEEGAGPPLPGVELRIRDGRIEVRSPSLLSGYFPAAQDPPLTRDGFLVTEDRGYLDGEGRLHLTGREDETIITGGENVDPAEVESALEEHPAIRESLVFSLPDPTYGQIVAALLVPRQTPPPSLDALATSLRERLASHARPRRLAWVEQIPLGPTGKPSRNAARKLFEQLPGRHPFDSDHS